MATPEGTKPFDAAELKPCALCGNGVMSGGNIVFYEVSVTSVVADLRAIRQLHGLETMMGNVALARTFSPNTAIGHRVQEPSLNLICMPCLTADRSLAVLMTSDDPRTTTDENEAHG